MITKAEAKRLRIFCIFALFVASILLGASFVAQKAGMHYIGPFTFNALRSFIGCVSLIPIMLFADKFFIMPKHYNKTSLIKGGIIAGVVLFIGFSINQYCMQFAEAGKAGFIMALYVVFVPVLARFLGHKLTPNVIVGIVLAMIGLYLLCAKNGLRFETWDIFLVISSFFFAIHIMIVNHYAKRVSPFKLSALQFLVMGILTLPLMLWERPELHQILLGIKPILFIGVVVTGLAYTLQIFGQKVAPPVLTTLILSSESVFAVLAGMIFLGETLSDREIFGCCFVIVALIISQLKFK